MAKTTLVKKEQKEPLKGEMAKPRVTGATMMKYSVFKTGLLHIHLCRRGLTVLIDSASYITIGPIVHVFPIIQSVILKFKYV